MDIGSQQDEERNRDLAPLDAQLEAKDEVIAELRSRVESLEQQLGARQKEIRRRDAALEREQQLAAFFAERVKELEAPSERPEAQESPETVEEEPEGAEPRSTAGGAQEVAESTQPQSGWLTPVDKLPWRMYVLGLLVLFIGYCSVLLAIVYASSELGGLGRWGGTAASVVSVLLWSLPGFLGLWIGLKRRRAGGWGRSLPQTILRGAATGIIAELGLESGRGLASALIAAMPPFTYDWADVAISLFYVLTFMVLYVSGELIGDAWQRRRAEKAQGEGLTRSASENTLSPRSQAMLGFAGTIISGLLALTGAVISALWGGG